MLDEVGAADPRPREAQRAGAGADATRAVALHEAVALEGGEDRLDVRRRDADRGGELGSLARRALEDERQQLRGAVGVGGHRACLSPGPEQVDEHARSGEHVGVVGRLERRVALAARQRVEHQGGGDERGEVAGVVPRARVRADGAQAAALGRLERAADEAGVERDRVATAHEPALEVRGIDADAIATVEAALDDAAADVAERRGVTVTRRLLRGGDPIALDPALAQRALDAAAARGLPAVRTYSGAGHDAGHLAARVPAALLFVPLAGGQSHTPHEAADADDVLAAAQVLVDVLAAN